MTFLLFANIIGDRQIRQPVSAKIYQNMLPHPRPTFSCPKTFKNEKVATQGVGRYVATCRAPMLSAWSVH